MDTEPVHPKWISFFDKEEYQQYQNFVRTRDFNKMLLSNRDFQEEKSPVTDLKSSTPEEVTSHPVSGSQPLETEYSEIPTEKPLAPPAMYPIRDEAKARRKRTRTIVLLGILMLSLIAMLVALLLHFHLQKSLFGSTEMGESVTVSPPPFYRSFTPQETERTSRTAFSSSAQTNQQLTAANVVASLEEKSVNMVCVLHGITDWQTISIVRLSDINPKEEVDVATITSLNDRPIIAVDPRMKPRFGRDGSDLKFVVQVNPPKCSDNGFYKCKATIAPDITVSSRFKVAFTSPVEVPVLHLPDELIEGKPTRIKTTWLAGYPEFSGSLEWEISNKDGETYTQLEYYDYKETFKSSTCTTIVESSFLITPRIDWNGTKIRTSIIPTPSLTDVSESRNLVSEPQDFLVIPASVCVNIKNGTFIGHPYTCHKFIRCTDRNIHVFVCPNDLCFDLDPNTCVTESNA